MTPAERRAHWGRVHVSADKRQPFEPRHVSERPFWSPLWVERALERKRA